MYELKKNGKVLTSKSVGTGPSSYEKENLPGRGLTKVEKHCTRDFMTSHDCIASWVTWTHPAPFRHISLIFPTVLSSHKTLTIETKIMSTFFISRLCAACTDQLIRFHSLTLKKYSEYGRKYELWRCYVRFWPQRVTANITVNSDRVLLLEKVQGNGPCSQQ